ncbi:MAG: cupin [Chloroflexi bacterium]|nr:MAG: cupin [Chloroflexota bacterium]PIE82532.1 MAG: cupin [Chloroflexota bacterium]
MSQQNLIKNIPFSEPQTLVALTDYEEGQVVSRTLAQNKGVSITLFAFAQGEGLSTHSAPGDAMVYILDGEAFITIDGKGMVVQAGETVIMPADIPHALDAQQRFKMLLIVVKKPKESRKTER